MQSRVLGPVCALPSKHICRCTSLIGASRSEPHTSDVSQDFSVYIYIYIYISAVSHSVYMLALILRIVWKLL